VSASSRAFSAALNHLLDGAAWARERLMAHPDRLVRLRADPVDIVVIILPDGRLGAAPDGAAPDVTLSVPLADAPRFLAGDASRAMNAVRVEGSAELADAFGFVLRNLRWDVEEDLARVVGDIPARRLVLGTRSLGEAGKRAWNALGENVAEYFAEEQGVLVTHASLAGFGDDVRALRDDVARLEKRIDRLTRRPSSAVPGRSPGTTERA
jgi:ubiquinone biosynthesis protein UbiJ